MRKFWLYTLAVLCVGVLVSACQKPVEEAKTPEGVQSEEVVVPAVENDAVVVVDTDTAPVVEPGEVAKTENYETYSATIQLIVNTPAGDQENSARVYRKDGKVLYEFLEIPQMNPDMKIKKILSVGGKVYAQYEIKGELVWGYEEGLDFPMEDLFDLKKTSDMFLNEINPDDTQKETIRGKDAQCVTQEEGGLKMNTCFLDGILFDGSSTDTETGMTMTLHVEDFTTEVAEDVFQIPDTTYSLLELNEKFQNLGQ